MLSHMVTFHSNGLLFALKRERSSDTCYKIHFASHKSTNSVDMRYPEVIKFIETKSEMVSASIWEEEGAGNKCLVGTEFQFGKMGHFRRWMVVIVVQQ